MRPPVLAFYLSYAPVIPSDYSEQLTYLLHYPTGANEGQGSLPISLLLQQAVSLSQEPSTSTGASIVLQNRNILDIPIEVPERPARLNTRKRGDGRPTHATKPSVSDKRDISALSSSFPDIPAPASIARNILERGESLGINRAFFSTVSEIRVSIRSLTYSWYLLHGVILTICRKIYQTFPLRFRVKPPSLRTYPSCKALPGRDPHGTSATPKTGTLTISVSVAVGANITMTAMTASIHQSHETIVQAWKRR